MKIAINGLGRIGRLLIRKIIANPTLELVAVNDIVDIKSIAHLIKYDSTHRIANFEISTNENQLLLNNKIVHFFQEKNPALLPWSKLDIDLVIECSGRFTSHIDASLHLQSGAKKVIISAPPKDTVAIKTIVMGVNETTINATDTIVSNASCTTNCFVPVVKVIDDNFEIISGFMNTVHAYTQDQHLQDTPHNNDLRRARAAAQNIVPTTTNAAKALEWVLPHLKNKLTSIAYRVPVVDVSLIDFTCLVTKAASVEEVNNAFKNAVFSDNETLEYATQPYVSSDIIGNNHAAIYDSLMTEVNGKLIRVVAWYDNENGYASRLSKLITFMQQFN